MAGDVKMNGRLKCKFYPDRIEYVHYLFTEKEAKEAIWPCEMCENFLWSPSPVCLPKQCRSENRRAKNLKPLNFKLQTTHLLHTCRWGTMDCNRVATEEEQKQRQKKKKRN